MLFVVHHGGAGMAQGQPAAAFVDAGGNHFDQRAPADGQDGRVAAAFAGAFVNVASDKKDKTGNLLDDEDGGLTLAVSSRDNFVLTIQATDAQPRSDDPEGAALAANARAAHHVAPDRAGAAWVELAAGVVGLGSRGTGVELAGGTAVATKVGAPGEKVRASSAR